MAAKKSSAKKASATKAAKKKPSKEKKGSKKAGSLAESTPKQCSDCVKRVIEEESGRKPKLDDKLSDLFVPCTPSVMVNLKSKLREQCSDRNIEVKCGKTVRRIIDELC